VQRNEVVVGGGEGRWWLWWGVVGE